MDHVEIIKGPDGKAKGFGIVEFAHPRDAAKAIRKLNETEFEGRTIYVRYDNDGKGDARGGGGDSDSDSVGDDSGLSLFVSNLSYDTTWQDLKDHCRAAGKVESANILTGREGRSIGCGVVVYQDKRGASRALRELQDTELDGRDIRLREDRGREDRRR